MNNPKKQVELDAETENRLQKVRYQLFKGGVLGFVVGVAAGAVGFVITPKILPKLKPKFNRNSFIATTLIAASVGSFIGAITYGKNAVQYIGDIFRINSNPTSTYQNNLNKNEQEILSSMDDSFRRRAESIQNSVQERRRSGNEPESKS